MGFLAPSLLFALVAAVVPYLVHRIGRRRPTPVPFAAMQLLLRAERRVRARTKLREILLLLLRTAVAAALPLVFSRPFVERAPDAPLSALSQQSAVIVLDDSASMRRRVGRRSMWDLAIDKASGIVRQLPSGSAVGLVLTSENSGAPVGALTLEKTRVAEAIDAARCSARPADFAAALRRASVILAEALHDERRIYVITDLQAVGWESAAGALPRGEHGEKVPQVTLLDLGAAHPWSNRAIVKVEAAPAPDLGPGGIVVSADVTDFGARARISLGMTLLIDGQVVTKGFVELPAGGHAQKKFVHVLPPKDDTGGVHDVTVSIDGDDFSLDDRRGTSLALTPAMRVLIVNGDPRTEKTEDEVFFVESALTGSGAGTFVTTVLPDDVPLGGLERFGVIFLANVDAPSAALATALTGFVSRGGGLFLSVGARVNTELWNARLAGLLPQPLGLVRTAAVQPGRSSGETVDERPAERLAPIDRGHPLTAGFSKEGDGLSSALFFRYTLLEPSPDTAGRDVILRFESGAPALVERTLPGGGDPAGNESRVGRVMLLATSIDRDWTDLPIRPGFLPLMVEATRRLAGAPSGEVSGSLLVGQPRTLNLAGDRLRIEITRPGGEIWVARRRTGEPAVTVTFKDSHEPGAYRVRTAGGDNNLHDAASENFVVNLDPRESDPRRLPPDQRPLRGPADAPGAHAPRQQEPIWHGLAMLIIALVLAESLFTLRRRETAAAA